MKCSVHSDREAVYHSGYSYCQECLIPLDQAVIDGWINELNTPLTMRKIKDTLTAMFGTPDYTFSAFPRLYGRWERGSWSDSNGYEVPQKEYIQRAFLSFIKEAAK